MLLCSGGTQTYSLSSWSALWTRFLRSSTPTMLQRTSAPKIHTMHPVRVWRTQLQSSDSSMLQRTNFPQVPKVSCLRLSPSILWWQFLQSFVPTMLLWKRRGSFKINMSKVWCFIVCPTRLSLLPWKPTCSCIC